VGALGAAPRATDAQQADSARVGVKRAAPEARAAATDTLAAATRPRIARVPIGPPVSATGALVRTLLVPGWGQSALRRPTAGALFVAAEMLSIAMLRKSAYAYREAKRFSQDSLLVGAWRVENDREVLDANGNPVPAATTPNFWVASGITQARRTFREDWAAAIVFNHLLAGADAFVAGQLWDLPAQVSLQPTATGGAALALSWRFR
jgi:hypothetical protein